MNIVSDRDGFVWKGHSHLAAHENKVKIPAGFQPAAVMQLHPPVAVTALMLHSDWGLVVAGTAHGLALFDYIRRKPVITKCTLNPNGELFVILAILSSISLLCHLLLN